MFHYRPLCLALLPLTVADAFFIDADAIPGQCGTAKHRVRHSQRQSATESDGVRHQGNGRARVSLAFPPLLRYRLSGTAVKEAPRDRRSKARLIRDCWPEFRPFVESGFLLKDIWVEWNGKLNVSYRQFTRVVMSLHNNAGELTARHTVPGKETTGKPATQPRVMANGREVDPFVNLKKTEGKAGFDYRGTRSVDELV